MTITERAAETAKRFRSQCPSPDAQWYQDGVIHPVLCDVIERFGRALVEAAAEIVERGIPLDDDPVEPFARSKADQIRRELLGDT